MIYLDHAATSFPKPDGVLEAIRHWFEDLGVSAGRGDGSRCHEVHQEVASVRQQLASRCGVPADRLVFTSGATESLNAFLAGTLERGDRVLTTALEHSSLARPLVHLRDSLGIDFDVLAPDAAGHIPPAAFADALARHRYRLVAFAHASNVVGTVLDAQAICRIAAGHGAMTLLDASPTAGLLPIDVGADAVAASAHKSLLGPPGLGILAVHPRVELRPTRFGGTGSSLALDRQPDAWPTAMESGTPNTPAILGLGAALRHLETQDADGVLAHGIALLDALRDELVDHADFYGPTTGPRIPIVSLSVHDLDPAEAGVLLAAQDIHVRTGFHCAPWIHEHLGTAERGTIRVSVGPFSTTADVAALARALAP